MFNINNVSKKYSGEVALNNVSIDIGKGFNFIVGASGSGKTTLLKIMSGMEQEFEGDVCYRGKSIKKMTSKEKSFFYNNIVGFVWQDFNLLEDSTVLENVLLPRHLKEKQSRKSAEKVLKDLKISDLAFQKVKYLSGGQKQRVAIARELMKNPEVIIADEPTSALDEQTTKITMQILRTLSKSKTVIVVTHDTSHILEKDNVYELDKGELVAGPECNVAKVTEKKGEMSNSLPLKNAIQIATSMIKNRTGRFCISTLSIVIASVMLLTTLSGAINDSSRSEFNKLLETYGDALTDIGIYNGFTDAAGVDGEENNKPSGEIEQDIGGLYELYAKDDRVSFITYLQAFDHITIQVDGKEYQVNNSGTMPSINKLVSGTMPMGDGKEVVVPESFVKGMGVTSEEAIGKEINFEGTITEWSNGNPVSKEVATKAIIVGIMDTTMRYNYEGQTTEFTIEDSFLFSKTALDGMLKQAGSNINNLNFLMRAKSPVDMISLKDELNGKGIVPIGRFELVEDMVRLNHQTTEQSGSASIVIAVLSLGMVVAIFLITGFMRKKEYAIYKVSGYHTTQLLKISFIECIFIAIGAIVLMLTISPLINLVTERLFHVNILNSKMLSTSVVIIGFTAMLAFMTTVVTIINVNISTALKAGER